MGRLFGTDGARGVAITELTCEMAMNIGRAAALVLTKTTVITSYSIHYTKLYDILPISY